MYGPDIAERIFWGALVSLVIWGFAAPHVLGGERFEERPSIAEAIEMLGG